MSVIRQNQWTLKFQDQPYKVYLNMSVLITFTAIWPGNKFYFFEEKLNGKSKQRLYDIRDLVGRQVNQWWVSRDFPVWDSRVE